VFFLFDLSLDALLLGPLFIVPLYGEVKKNF